MGIITPHTVKGCVVRRTTSQNVLELTTTPLNYNTIIRDDANFTTSWSGGNGTRLTAPYNGWYSVFANCHWNESVLTGSNGRIMELRLDGTTYFPTQCFPNVAVNARQSASMMYYLTAGQYFEVTTYQDSGSTRTILTTYFGLVHMSY